MSPRTDIVKLLVFWITEISKIKSQTIILFEKEKKNNKT